MEELLVMFTLGYILGGISALLLLAFTLSSRAGSAGLRRGRKRTRDA